MKHWKRPVALWMLAGVLLSLCTLGTAVYGMNSSPALLIDSAQVCAAAEQMLESACDADFEGVSQLLVGTPDLGQAPEKEETAQSMLWYAYLDSVEYRVGESCYPSGASVMLDVYVNCLDISAVTEALQTTVPDMIIQAVGDQVDEEQLHDQVLRTAIAQVLTEPPMEEHVLSLEFVHDGGVWQAVPSEQLLQFLSGFVTE